MLNFDNDNNLEDRKFYLDLESLKLRKFLEKEINYGIFGTSAPTVSIKQYYDENKKDYKLMLLLDSSNSIYGEDSKLVIIKRANEFAEELKDAFSEVGLVISDIIDLDARFTEDELSFLPDKIKCNKMNINYFTGAGKNTKSTSLSFLENKELKFYNISSQTPKMHINAEVITDFTPKFKIGNNIHIKLTIYDDQLPSTIEEYESMFMPYAEITDSLMIEVKPDKGFEICDSLPYRFSLYDALEFYISQTYRTTQGYFNQVHNDKELRKTLLLENLIKLYNKVNEK